MKKLVVILLSLMLVGSMNAAMAETYEGTGNGRNGAVKVSVTFEEGKISLVEVLEQSETAGVADGALAQIPAAIVGNQSTAVEAVTGATLTSNAIIEAVEDCLVQAGEDVKTWRVAAAEAAVEKETVQETVD